MPKAVDDLYHAIIDLGFLAEADHPAAQVLLVEVAFVKGRVELRPDYGLFLLERAAGKGHGIANEADLRRRVTEGLSDEVIAEVKALAARPDGDYALWLLEHEKKGKLPE